MGREGAARAQGAGEDSGCGGMMAESLYPPVLAGLLHILGVSSLGGPYHRSVPPSSSISLTEDRDLIKDRLQSLTLTKIQSNFSS